VKIKKLVKKLEKAFKERGPVGLMELSKKKKIRKAVKKAMSNPEIKKKIAELE
jgi:hypothetical protein